MNLFEEMIAKGCDGPTAAQKKEIEKMKKLDVQHSVKRPAPAFKSMIRKSGPGGVIFDFGNDTGNPMADRLTHTINQNIDQAWSSQLTDQNARLNKSLERFVEVGEAGLAHEMRNGTRTEDLSKSTDERIVEMCKSGELDCNNERQGAVGSNMKATGECTKSEMMLDGDHLVGQSETDAAVIEMAKSMGLGGGEKTPDTFSNEDIDKLLRAPS